MAQGVPHGFMHMVYINQFKALIKLWHGKFKGLDSSTSHYIIPHLIWKTISIETQQAIKTILASFIHSIPNIKADFHSFTAEDNLFWLTWLALYLLTGHLSEPYYSHMLNLIKIIKVCTGFSMTRAELKALGTDLYNWCLDYEDHYFQHNPKHLSIMTLASHRLDHLLDNINNTGPLAALWEFVTKQSMGEVTCSVTSRVYPFSQLANTLLQQEQLKGMRMQYPDLSEELDYSGGHHDWNRISSTEKCFPEINN